MNKIANNALKMSVKRNIYFAKINSKAVSTTVFAKNAIEDNFFPVMILKKGRMNLI
jgi:hypothetical protein